MGYQGTYCFDAFESRSQSAIGLLNGVHGCGASPEFWGEPLSAEDMLPVIPMTDTLEISGTIATITTTLPVTVTNLEQDGQMAVITSTETVTITGTISPTEAISGTGWVRTRGLASMLPPKWLMAPAGQDGGSNPGTSLVMDIDYTYDPLYRLTDAVYNGGYYSFKYLYDAVGNRTQMVSGSTSSQVITTTYSYDIANRLTSVDGIPYTWDNNGNLLHDGLNTYTYDQANHLISVMSMPPATTFTYNGLGDRAQQTYAGNTTTYLLDIASSLTQVLADSNGNAYLYGLGHIGEEGGAGWQYHHGDALGSVRQLTDASGAISLAKSYEPYGDLLSSAGDVDTPYDFAGEWRDNTGLIFLRARYYESTVGRFISRDSWQGGIFTPMSYNLWAYAYANPLRYTDPNGQNPLLAVLAPIAISAFVGAIIGGATAGIYGAATYEWALAGECGCDIQAQALSMTKGEWTRAHAISGAIFGGIAAPIATAAPIGMIAVGAGGLYLSGTDLIRTVNTIRNETGWTKCTGTRLTIDVAGALGSTAGIYQGFKAWNISKSPFRWAPSLLPVEGRVDPNRVRYSQDSISYRFKNGSTIDDLAEGLRSGQVNPNDVPPIRILERDGKLYTLDNRRLEAFRRAGVKIPYRLATPEEIASENWKFTTYTDGITIRVRGEP